MSGVQQHALRVAAGHAGSCPLSGWRHCGFRAACAAQQLGYEKIVVVLTKNRGYRKEPSRMFTKMAAYEYRKYPKLCQTIARRYVAYNRTMERLEKLEEEGKILSSGREEGHRADGAGSEEAGGVLRGRLPPHGRAVRVPVQISGKIAKSPFPTEEILVK